MTDTTTNQFDQWAIVDVMGHQRFVGRVTEQVIAGQGFIRIDIPASGDTAEWTKIVGTGSIYSITPVSEEIARGMAARCTARPVQAYELPQLTNQSKPTEYDEDEWPI